MDALRKHSTTPHIEVIDIDKTNEEKGTQLHFEVNDAFLDMVKTEKNVKQVSQEMLSSYVQELVTKCASSKDGYTYEKILENTQE
tara:strand:- start:230 stop:484 length:255 start_codon:yes stop_codon:yes gene_type:complete